MSTTLGDRLRFLRKLHGKTQEELGEMIGTSKTAIHNYETNRTIPSTNKLVKLADLLNVSIDYLIGRSDRMHEAKEIYVTHRKFPLLSREDAKNPPQYAATVAYDYIEAPVAEESSDVFAVSLEKEGISFLVIVKQNDTTSDFVLCNIDDTLCVLPREKANTAVKINDKMIGGIVCFV